jgi:hypothetical protein
MQPHTFSLRSTTRFRGLKVRILVVCVGYRPRQQGANSDPVLWESFLDIYFLEDDKTMLLRNVGIGLVCGAASHPRKTEFSSTLLRKSQTLSCIWTSSITSC